MIGDPLGAVEQLAGSGLEAQSFRLRVIAENLANANSTGATPGSDPYRRRTVQFQAVLDQNLGTMDVTVKGVATDPTAFRIEHDPGHPAADKDGNVKLPNVNPLIEMADMREANRSYETNLQMFKQARSMIAMTIDLLRGS